MIWWRAFVSSKLWPLLVPKAWTWWALGPPWCSSTGGRSHRFVFSQVCGSCPFLLPPLSSSPLLLSILWKYSSCVCVLLKPLLAARERHHAVPCRGLGREHLEGSGVQGWVVSWYIWKKAAVVLASALDGYCCSQDLAVEEMLCRPHCSRGSWSLGLHVLLLEKLYHLLPWHLHHHNRKQLLPSPG